MFEKNLCSSFLSIWQNSALLLSSSGLPFDLRLFISCSVSFLSINLFRFSISLCFRVGGSCVWVFPSCLVSPFVGEWLFLMSPCIVPVAVTMPSLQLLASFIFRVFFSSLTIELYYLSKELSITEFSAFVSLLLLQSLPFSSINFKLFSFFP